MRLKNAGYVVLACLLLAPLSVSAQVLYATQGCRPCMPYPDGLFTLNPADGTATLIGNMGESVVALDVHPITGVLYGTTTSASANPSSLITINTSDASVTVVGPHGLDNAIVDLTFAPDGTLYGWIQPNLDQAVRLDLATGAASPLSYSGLSTLNAAFDLGPTGFFYLFGNNTSPFPPGSIARLQVADGAPLDAVPLNPFAGERYAAGSFNGSGVLYAIAGPDTVNLSLVTVDFQTGGVSVIGGVPDYLAGLAWSTTPEIPWPAPLVTPVPAMSRSGIVVLAVLLGGLGALLVRRLSNR